MTYGSGPLTATVLYRTDKNEVEQKAGCRKTPVFGGEDLQEIQLVGLVNKHPQS